MNRLVPLLSRRQFLRCAGLVSASAAAVPLVLRQSLLGANAPSNRIVLGMIGMGRQMLALNLQPFLESPDCLLAAVCDVDAWRLEQGLKAVQDFYAAKQRSGRDTRCTRLQGFP